MMRQCLQARRRREILDHAMQLHVMLRPDPGSNARDKWFGELVALNNDWHASRNPHESERREDRNAELVYKARQAFANVFGVDPADPRFKAWEAQHLAKIK